MKLTGVSNHRTTLVAAAEVHGSLEDPVAANNTAQASITVK